MNNPQSRKRRPPFPLPMPPAPTPGRLIPRQASIWEESALTVEFLTCLQAWRFITY